jgi:outer membrane protein OmpA-like peptidoglycan-associated protein
VIKIPATRFVAAAVLVGGLAATSLLDNGDATDAGIDDPLPPPSPQFIIEWRQGRLGLSGHTTSIKHEKDLLQVAASSFPGIPVVTDFIPLGIVPEYWEDTTAQVTYLLAVTSSAEAVLSRDTLTVRGVIVDDIAWQSRLDAVQQALPDQVVIESDTILVDDDSDVVEFCKRAFLAFETGAIYFEESNATFRSSAYPRLDRVIALAKACSTHSITITGYTDSTGSETANQSLSFKRATAVGNYIADGGVDNARLSIIGAGSVRPIADNATRYGRSLNRRIEIDFESITPVTSVSPAR